MPRNDIAMLAQREAAAETARSKADERWRTAWWALTLALGALPEGEKKKVGEAQALVREITGQSLSYVKRRTRAGRGFSTLKGTETLPPRMAVEVVEQGIVPDAALVKRLLQAEKDGMSLREWSAELSGKAWADTPAGASAQTIEDIVAAQPQAVAAVVGTKMATSPEFASGVTEAMGTAAKELPVTKRDELTASVVGASVGVTSEDKADTTRAVKRAVAEHEAKEEEAPSGIRALKVLPVIWEVDALLEQFEAAPRDEESVAVMGLFARWAESMARRAKVLADGDFLPPSDDEFARGIEAILDGAS